MSRRRTSHRGPAKLRANVLLSPNAMDSKERAEASRTSIIKQIDQAITLSDAVYRRRPVNLRGDLNPLLHAIYHLGYAKCQLRVLSMMLEATPDKYLRDVLDETGRMYHRAKSSVEETAQLCGFHDIQF